MVTIEGPRFSSKMESKLFHSWGAHVINMSTVPEVMCVVLCVCVCVCVCVHACMCSYIHAYVDCVYVHT